MTATTDMSTARRLLLAVYVASVVAVVPGLTVVLAVHEKTALSALDEVAHLDYLDRAGELSLPRMGDLVSDEITALARCRIHEVEVGEPCTTLPPRTDPPKAAGGYSYEAQHPPAYYWISAQLERITGAGPVDNFITSARLTGVFWIVGGVATLYGALRRLGAGHAATGACCCLLTMSPGLLQSTAKVTNDATSLLAGAAVLLVYTYVRSDPRWPAVVGSAAVAASVVLLKPVNIVVVGAVAAALFVELVPRLGWRSAGLLAGVPAAVGAATVLAWRQTADALARVDPDVVMAALLEFKQTSDGPPIGQFFLSASRLLDAYDSGVEIAGLGAVSVAIVARYAILGTATVTALRGGRSPAALLGASSLVALVLAGVAFNIQFWLSYDLTGGPAARYGLSLLPVLVVPMAVEAGRSTRATTGVWVLAGIMAVVTTAGVVLS